MNAITIRFIALLVAVCVLVGINVAAAALRVPLASATIADAVASLVALAGLLIGDTFKPPTPPA